MDEINKLSTVVATGSGKIKPGLSGTAGTAKTTNFTTQTSGGTGGSLPNSVIQKSYQNFTNPQYGVKSTTPASQSVKPIQLPRSTNRHMATFGDTSGASAGQTFNPIKTKTVSIR